MTYLELLAPGPLTLQARKDQTLLLYVCNQTRPSATYKFAIYADNDSTLKEYTLQTGVSIEGVDLKIYDQTLNAPTGTYQYRFVRTTPEITETVIEGSIIIN